MNWDEFSFANQQLAGMLKSGIPLEGGLRQLCASMRRGDLRRELELLEADLAKGVPLKEALSARRLPAFYVSMVRAGAQSGDLPGVLLRVADYYARLNTLWTRLKGLLVYPAIVMFVCLVSSLVFSIGIRGLLADIAEHWFYIKTSAQVVLNVWVWVVPGLFAGGLLIVLFCLARPGIRQNLRWYLPGFKEASLSGVAAMLAMLLRGGNTLSDSLQLVKGMEAGTPAEKDLAVWQKRLAEGQGKLSDLAKDSAVFPPLFVWLAASGGEDLEAGFNRAADIYYRRAMYRSEMFLYAALPIVIVFLGAMVVTHAASMFELLFRMMGALGDF